MRNILRHKGIVYTSAMVIGNRRLSSVYSFLELELLQDFPLHKPPQFIMAWVPGYEAVPMTIARRRGDRLWILVKIAGDTTRRLAGIEEGSFIGLYGPLGKPLIPLRNKFLFLVGGSGVATALNYLSSLGCSRDRCLTVFGCWRYGEVGSVPELIEEFGSATITACLDRRCDVYGTVVDALDNIDPGGYDVIVACGPPGMLKSLIDRIPLDKSIFVLDSYVKCGLGLCGSCLVPGTRYYLCIDGPGFYAWELVEAGWH